MKVGVGVATDIGKVRGANEDSYLVEPPLFAVADGMGGHRGGDVASKLALETVEQLCTAGQSLSALRAPAPLATSRGIFALPNSDMSPAGIAETV